MKRSKKIVLAAVLLALLIVLSRFLSVKTPITKISFAFIPTMLCAAWLGWRWTLAVNILGDVIGALLFPTGPFFIGYTVSTAIAGVIYGVLLYRYGKKRRIAEGAYAVKVAAAVLLVTVIVNMGLNTLWTSITAGQAFFALFWARLGKELFMAPVRIVVFLAVERALRRPFERYVMIEPVKDD